MSGLVLVAIGRVEVAQTEDRAGDKAGQQEAVGAVHLCVPKTSSMSSDQAVLVDQTGDVSLPSDAVLVEIDRFG